jgi:hypothetical protein
MIKRTPPPPPPRSNYVPLRSPSGHLIGYLDRARMILEVKPRAGRPTEEIDLAAVLKAKP